MTGRNGRRAFLILTAFLVLGFVAVAARPSRADVIYSNLGPGPGAEFLFNKDYQTNFDFLASPFIATGGGNLGDVVIPLFSLNNPVSLGLYTDSGGSPGSLLESWSATVPGFPAELITIPSVQTPLLSAGTEYWFVIALTNPQKDHLAWYENNQGVNGGVWAWDSVSAIAEL